MTATSNVLPATTATSRLSPELTRLAVLLALSIFINYIDRGNLALAAPLIKDELGLSFYQIGLLLSSFFWTYAIFQIVSGWLVDRFPVNWVLALGILLWSAATLGTGLVHSFTMLLAMRLILGIGESVAYPSYSKNISRHFSEFQRGRANSLISAGQASGPAFGTLLGGMLIAHVGWRFFFIIFGIASSLWLLPWLKYMPRAAQTTEVAQEPATVSVSIPANESPSATILQILRQTTISGISSSPGCPSISFASAISPSNECPLSLEWPSSPWRPPLFFPAGSPTNGSPRAALPRVCAKRSPAPDLLSPQVSCRW